MRRCDSLPFDVGDPIIVLLTPPNDVSTCAKPGRNFAPNLLFSLDSSAQEIYTFVSRIAASMIFIDWERRQTQPRQSIKPRQHTRGTRYKAFPEVFKSPMFMHLRKLLRLTSKI
jgi:hypothetical protein